MTSLYEIRRNYCDLTVRMALRDALRTVVRVRSKSFTKGGGENVQKALRIIVERPLSCLLGNITGEIQGVIRLFLKMI